MSVKWKYAFHEFERRRNLGPVMPECSEYHPSKQSPVVCTLLPGSSYLEPAPCFCPSFYLCQFFKFKIFLENVALFKSLFFSPIALIHNSVCACMCVCVCMCVCACTCRCLCCNLCALDFENNVHLKNV